MDERTRKWKCSRLTFVAIITVLINGKSATGLRGVSIYRPDSLLVYRFPVSEIVLRTEISFTFSANSCSGVIVEMTSKDTDRFFRFSLTKDGELTFSFKNEGEDSWDIKPPNGGSFCDGEEHSVAFGRVGNDVNVRVDKSNKVENRTFPTLVLPFSKPDKLVFGGSSISEVSQHFKGCIVHVRVINYKTMDDPEPFAVEPIALYLQQKSRSIEGKNVHPCDYVPTTPRSAGQRMSKTGSVSQSSTLYGNPLLLVCLVVLVASLVGPDSTAKIPSVNICKNEPHLPFAVRIA